jgi:cellulose synthase/poly-beta-1,6-N-acetylglucosamine synthase-like glycosyltransferase
VTAPERTEFAEPLVLGVIEAPLPALKVTSRRQLMAVGWVWSPHGRVDLQVLCDGQPLHSLQYGLTRSDVAAAWPSMPDAARSGFVGVIDIDMLTAGVHAIVMHAAVPGGASREWRRNFVVGDPVAAYQRWLAHRALHLPQGNSVLSASWPLTVIVDAERSDDRVALWRTLASTLRLMPHPREVIVCRTASASDAAPGGAAEFGSRFIAGTQLRYLRGGLREALAASRTEWVTILTAGEVLHPRALHTLAAEAALHPACDLWYADHDHFRRDGGRYRPVLKPAWSPVWLRQYNYVGHPWFGRGLRLRDIAAEHGPATPLHEHDALLRLGESRRRSVGHIPSILLSRSEGHSIPIFEAHPRHRKAKRSPRVTIIIPSRLSVPDIVARCLDGLTQGTHYENLEIVVVLNSLTASDEGVAWLSRWPSVTARYSDGPFNWSLVNNLAAESAQCEFLLFLNDDIECIEPNWLTAMVELADEPDVGAVGAVLRYPDGRIQHAGVQLAATGAIECRHALRFCRSDDPALQWLLRGNRDQSAVTGACLLTRRDVFQRAGGFDERLALVLNDVDYCLRLGRMGLRSVVAGEAVLIHHEGLSRAGMPESEDVRVFAQRWQGTIPPVDPFGHPCVRRDSDDWTLDTDAVVDIGSRVLPTQFEMPSSDTQRNFQPT